MSDSRLLCMISPGLWRFRFLGRGAFAGLAMVLLAQPATAEIYKCIGPDGKTSYTSDPTQCARAQPHELKREIQVEAPRRGGSHSARQARTGSGVRPAAPAGDTSGLEQMWRRKREETRTKIAEVERLQKRNQKMVTGCNRGSEWYATDKSGIRRNVSCKRLRRETENLERQRQALNTYLQSGLAEECRRAGCLPGWIR